MNQRILLVPVMQTQTLYTSCHPGCLHCKHILYMHKCELKIEMYCDTNSSYPLKLSKPNFDMTNSCTQRQTHTHLSTAQLLHHVIKEVCVCSTQQHPEGVSATVAAAPALLLSTAAGRRRRRRFDSTLPSVQQKQMLLEVLRMSERKEQTPRRMVMDDNNNNNNNAGDMYR